MKHRKWAHPALLAAITTALVVAVASSGSAGPRQARYEGAGANVVRVGVGDLPTIVDEGEMRCSMTTGNGVGGSCIGFDLTVSNPAISVRDANPTIGTNVAFQVCIDNDGDRFCTSPGRGPCADDIVFSHLDGGPFFNPLTVPPGFRPGCPGGPFRGWIVFICGGAHVDSTGPHQHQATVGTTTLVSGGTGTGNFCGGSPQFVSQKRYTLTS